MICKSQRPQSPGIAKQKASFDAACKRLLADKNILAQIMKSCIPEYQQCTIDDIIYHYIEGTPRIGQDNVHPDEIPERIRGLNTEDTTITEGTVFYDIRFEALAPSSGEEISLLINIEAQNNFYPGYPLIKRGIYYCSRMTSAQYGTYFCASDYGSIKKVYSIWVCTSPPKFRENTINRYCWSEECVVGNVTEEKSNYDLMTVIVICLGSEDSKNYGGILRLLEVLLSAKRPPDEKRRILQDEYHIPMAPKLERQVLEMCNLSDGIVDESLCQSITNLMKNLNLTMEQAMKALGIQESDYDKYKSLLETDQ